MPKNNGLICFVDLDEVLSDFESAALDAHRIYKLERYKDTPSEYHWYNQPATPGIWDLRVRYRTQDSEQELITLEEFWKPILKTGTGFWERVKPTSWMLELINYVDHNFQTWYILSSPGSGNYEEHAGKVLWIQNQFGADFRNFLLTSDKQLLAKPGRVLIDDNQNNCNKFSNAGGSGVLFPSMGNSLHEHCKYPLGYFLPEIHRVVTYLETTYCNGDTTHCNGDTTQRDPNIGPSTPPPGLDRVGDSEKSMDLREYAEMRIAEEIKTTEEERT
jgi:hypothetical protein